MKKLILFMLVIPVFASADCGFDKITGKAQLRAILSTPQFGQCSCDELKTAQATLLNNMKLIKQSLEQNFVAEMAGGEVKNIDFYTFLNQINSARAARSAILSIVADTSLSSPCRQ